MDSGYNWPRRWPMMLPRKCTYLLSLFIFIKIAVAPKFRNLSSISYFIQLIITVSMEGQFAPVVNSREFGRFRKDPTSVIFSRALLLFFSLLSTKLFSLLHISFFLFKGKII